MSGRGFTLIELTVVLLILAILAAAVTLRAQGPMSAARVDDAAGAVAAYDAATRSAAQSQDRPLTLVIDLSEGRLSREDAHGRRVDSMPLDLPSSVRLSLWLDGRRIEGGQASIRVSSHGQTPSYAVRIASSGRETWRVFAGLTGGTLAVEDESQVQDILAVGAGRDAR